MTGGTGCTCSCTCVADPHTHIHSKSLSISMPCGDEHITMWRTSEYGTGITLTSLVVSLTGDHPTDNIDWSLRSSDYYQSYYSKDAMSGGTISSCNTLTAHTYHPLGLSDHDSIGAGQTIWLDIRGMSGTVNEFNITVEYEKD